MSMSPPVTTSADEDDMEDLRARLAEAEETLRAIRAGEVDALVVDRADGPAVFTLKDAAEPYRLLVEQMAQGALTVAADGVILYCNNSFAHMLGRPRERVIGTDLAGFVAPAGRPGLQALLMGDDRAEIPLRHAAGQCVETLITAAHLPWEGVMHRCLAVTDLSEHELRLRHHAVTDASHDLIYALDPDLTIRTWNRGAEMLTGLSAEDAVGQSERALWPENLREQIDALVQAARRDGGAVSVDTQRLRADGSPAELVYTLTPLKGSDARLSGYSVVAHDITERKEAERRLQFLTSEVNHRSMNLLATVKALANLTATRADGLKAFLADYNSRLEALAETHMLLSASRWNGAAVADLVQAVLKGFEMDRIGIGGCRAMLHPRPAQDLALSLNELATNAVKYGSLSVRDGAVSLSWGFAESGLVIEWRESGGPPVSPPTRQGLGSRVIRQTGGDGGSVDYRFEPDGVSCRIMLPAACLSSRPPQ